MSRFDKKSLENASLWSTYTPKYSVPCSITENSYFNRQSKINGSTSENLSSTTTEAHAPPIDKEW